MSHDPFDWPKQGAPSSGLGGSTCASQDPFSSAGFGSQQQAPAPAGGWVAFDDDASGTALRTASAPSHAATTGASTWAASFSSAENGWSNAPSPWAEPSASRTNPLTNGPPEARAGVTASAPGPAPASVSLAAPGPGPGATATTAPSLPSQPAFSRPISQSVAPTAGAGAGAGAASSHLGTAPPGRASYAAPAAPAIHRLPRPPTSASRGGQPATSDGNPFALTAATPGTLSSNNPFAAANTKPHGTTVAASRSLDPFADLSLKPQLPRPPPMAAARGPPSAAAAPTAGALGPAPAAAQATEAGLGAQTGLPAQASALGLAARMPAAAALQQPAAAAAPGAALGSSPFPTFGSLHRQPPATGPVGAEATTGSSLDRGGGVAPHSALTGTVGPPPVLTRAQALVDRRPAGALRTAAAGDLRRPGGEPNVIETTSFDAFTTPSKAAAARAAERTTPAPAAKAQPSPPLPPPPSYNVAVDLPSASPPPDALLLYDTPSAAAAAAVAPPPPPVSPPPYFEALDMPPAEPPASVPPPSYEEAFLLPAADLGVAAGGSATAAAPLVPLTAPDLGDAASWPAFDDLLLNNSATAGASAMAAAIRAPQASPLRSGATASQASAQASSALPGQICVEVRLPPLKPKEASCPRRLVAGMGMAFAAPAGDGAAALRWSLRPAAQHHHHHHAPGRGQGRQPRSAAADAQGTGPCFEVPAGAAAPRPSEDWDSAPAAAVQTSQLPDLATTCSLLLDDVSGSLWTGHKDGRVVRWKVEPGRPATFQHQWKPHFRGKVTNFALDPWGDLWTASSAGTVRVWHYPATGPGTQPPVRLFECRRSRLTLGANSRAAAQRAHSKARLLALGPSGRVMWSAGRTALVLWGSYDGEYLGTMTPGVVQDAKAPVGPTASVYGGDTGAGVLRGEPGQLQLVINSQTGLETSLVNRPISPRMVDGGEEAEVAEQELGQVFKDLAGGAFKLASKLGKKIRQNLQQYDNSNAASGADAAGPHEPGLGPGGAARGKVVALVPGLDASMYVAYHEGVLEKYTEWGRLLWTKDYGRGAILHSAVLVGSLLWLGCGDGFIRTASACAGDLGRSWKAHDFPVVALAHDAGVRDRGSGLVYSLSEIGSVRAWPAVPPAEPQLLAWRNGLLPCLHRRQLTVLAATWNVNEMRPSSQSLRRWLAPAAAAEIAAIALQEVEMGTSSVARDAAITFLSKGMLERGNQNAQWWAVELGAALEYASGSWSRVALRQMSGLVVVVFCRTELLQHVGEVATANVACGVMGVGGNKGAVAVSMSVFRRRLMFVSSHFAAHQDRVDERNDNYHKIVRLLHFSNTSKAAHRQQSQLQQQPTSSCSDAIVHREAGFDGGGFDGEVEAIHHSASGRSLNELEDDGHGPGLSDAAMLVWAGDFNYRINMPYGETRDLACAGEFAQLFVADQCRIEMERGNVFRGLREPLPLGHPVFAPTYKYDKGVPHMVLAMAPGARPQLRLPYDSSEKQRVPGWTDRVFYRGSRPGGHDITEEEVQVSIATPTDYNCVLDVNDSDHKPVYALLQVQLPSYKQEEKRRHSLASALAVHQAVLVGPGGAKHHPPPQAVVRLSAESVEVRPRGDGSVCLLNSSPLAFHVQVVAERPLEGSPGGHDGAMALCPLPHWLEVTPMSFTLPPCAGTPGNSQGSALVLLRTPPCDDVRPLESVQLRFRLHPLWGAETVLGVVGPVLKVVRPQSDGSGF